MLPSRVLCALLLGTAAGHSPSLAQTVRDTASRTLLVPDAVWDGVNDVPQRGWGVLLRGNRITLLPALIEAHSPLFLLPYT